MVRPKFFAPWASRFGTSPFFYLSTHTHPSLPLLAKHHLITMKLFTWPSETFAQYGDGSIIVMATDREAARAKALEYILRWKEDEDFRASVNADLNREPLTDEVVIIPGSA